MSLPAATLIISSRDRPALLTALVESVLALEEGPAEVVVVDQSRAPHTRLASLDGGRLRYLWSRSVGVSRSRNMGIAAARHDALVFADDDIVITPTWFGTIVRGLLAAGPRAVVVGSVLAGGAELDGGFAPSTMPPPRDTRPVVYTGRIGRDVLYSNLAMCRSTVDEIGPFDERLGPGSSFPSSEDNDYCFRLLEAGYRIVYLPDAVVYHRAWRGRGDYLPLHWRYGRGQGAYYAKHLSLSDRYMLGRFGSHAVRHLRRAASLARQPLLACGEAVYVAGLLVGAAQWLLTQQRGAVRQTT